MKQTLRRPALLAVAGIVALALVMRLAWVLVIVPNPTIQGGDGPYYLSAGRSLAGRGDLPWSRMLAIGPVYPLYLSIFYRLLPTEAAVFQAARVGQAVVDSLTCLAVFDLGRRLFGSRTGLLAAALLAVDLRFVVQVNQIATETIFIFFLVTSSRAFVAAREAGSRPGWRPAGAAALGLLAAFTRAIALPIPALLTGSLLLPKPSRAQWLAAGGIVGLLAAGVILWSIRQYQATGQWVIISDGLGGNFWMGSRGDGQWHGNAEFQGEINDLKLRYHGRLAYVEDAFQTILADPLAYGRLLAGKTAAAYLQPYGTVPFHGDSLKDLAVKVVRGEIGVAELLGREAFWPKLYIYLLHFTGLAGGAIGAWLTRRDWLKMLPLTLPIVYLSAAYALLTIIPRYLFPTMPFYTLLAAYSLSVLAGAGLKRVARGAR